MPSEMLAKEKLLGININLIVLAPGIYGGA